MNVRSVNVRSVNDEKNADNILSYESLSDFETILSDDDLQL